MSWMPHERTIGQPARRFLAIAALLVPACAVAGIAGPAQAVIVNVDASVHISGSSLGVPLVAGDYTATLLDGLNDGDAATLFTAWSFSFGNPGTWETAYRIELSDGDLTGGFFADADSASEAFAETEEVDRLVLSFTVPTDETVGFRVLDNVGFDNPGGVSLDVQRVVEDDNGVSVPEPGTLALLGAGLTGGLLLRRRRRA